MPRPTASPDSFRWALVAAILSLALASPAMAQWVKFEDQTTARLNVVGSLGANDIEEKEYAWGDVDKDGDIDLVVVRKQPFTTPGKRTSVLLMNENGVLTDRTVLYATDSDVPGDQGFKTPTNTRDVRLDDFNDDTFLDIVTAVTISDGDPKHVGHPRIYINKGCNGVCNGTNWLGFRYEQNRIPTMTSWSDDVGHNPRFCSVGTGDVTGDGYPDLWFGDYDSSGVGGGSPEPPGSDFNDRLLINQGEDNPGFFTDVTKGVGSHFSGTISIPGAGNQHFAVSAFGAAAEIADVNGDGKQDIVKQTSLSSPLYVGVAYNNPANEGFFSSYEVVTQQSPYFVSVGDLNNDNRLDLVITDDGDDRYLMNTGTGTDGKANFQPLPFTFQHAGTGGASSDDGFGSDSLVVDLDNDGWKDVLIADVDVDIDGCGRRMHIYRNLGGDPGDLVELQEQTSGADCETFKNHPPQCIVTTIPASKLKGVHDVAVFDINGDGWDDMVVGRCSTTEVWMNLPPFGLQFEYPDGLPSLVTPEQSTVIPVELRPVGGATVTTATLFVSIDGGPFNSVPLTFTGSGDLYEATLPPADCAQHYDFYISANIAQGGTFVDPPGAPAQTHSSVAAVGTSMIMIEEVEGSVSTWSTVDHASVTTGTWEQAVPNGTLVGAAPAAPSEDAQSGPGKVRAFVTENGEPGGAASAADVDGGPVDLLSPPFNLAGADAIVSYYRWFFSTGSDTLTVWVSNDGSSWQLVETVSGSANTWRKMSFQVGDFVTPSSTVQLRFRTSDNPDDSITEAGIDLVTVEAYLCASCQVDEDCVDGLFCNGLETCDNGGCLPGATPCAGQVCDETGDVCLDCFNDTDCDDHSFCNGQETCAGNTCLPGGDPCPGELCDEVVDACVTCLTAADCDDGLFCNGAESCSGGTCFVGGNPCPGQFCDEQQNVCVGTMQIQPRMGEPITGLTAGQLNRFTAGKVAFDKNFGVPQGLGPVFNQDSCGSCHNTRLGGSGSITVTRFGRTNGAGEFDGLESLGGSLLQSNAISPECAETIPPEATIAANRLTNSTLGFGLVQAIPDAAIQALADNPPAGVSGRATIVPVLEGPPGTTAVGRFGWKSQVATVRTFSADAALNEMGITNRLLQQDVAPNGNAALLAQCDTVADPEDKPDLLGFFFVDRVTDFQRFLAPPPQTPRSGMTGETLFNAIGCASCHVGTFATPNDPALEQALRDKTLKPYSDFLLHDMGGNADGIAQGQASPQELRTPPLWGVRVRDPLWHDGRVTSGSFASRIQAAVAEHDDPLSEAKASAQAFAALSPENQDAVIAFLDSLGRAEFDFDGDNHVNSVDWQMFTACFTGSGSFYTPDDACALADIDQDGDVDDNDYAAFLAASPGSPSGEVPETLVMNLTPGGDVTLDWHTSCQSGDTDYEVYTGTIGDFSSYTPELCTTNGQTAATVTVPDNTFFLVVPHNTDREGSYGETSAGVPRPRSTSACLPQVAGVCQ
jgi:hypothetical protein